MKRQLVAIVAIWLASDSVLRACPVCFQMDDAATAAGVRAAVLVLMGVTAAVLAGVGTWWLRFTRRSR